MNKNYDFGCFVLIGSKVIKSRIPKPICKDVVYLDKTTNYVLYSLN